MSSKKNKLLKKWIKYKDGEKKKILIIYKIIIMNELKIIQNQQN